MKQDVVPAPRKKMTNGREKNTSPSPSPRPASVSSKLFIWYNDKQ
jgi:hypothetical protein